MTRPHCDPFGGFPAPPAGKTGWPWTADTPRSHGAPSLPRISVVTPSFNQARFLEEAIRSVLLQGYANLEYFIMDGGSTDGSVEIIRRYEPWLAGWESVPDRGQSHAINKGIERASGDWVAWLNADDAYLDRSLWNVARMIQDNPGTQWIVGTTLMCDEHLRELWPFRPHFSTGEWKSLRYLSTGSWVDLVCSKHSGTALPQPSSFWSRNAVEKAGRLNQAYHYAMDHELYVRLARSGALPLCVDEPLALYRTNEGSKTSQGKLGFWREELRVLEESLPFAEPRDRDTLLAYRKWLTRQVAVLTFRDFCRRLPLLSRIERAFPHSNEALISRISRRVRRSTGSHE